MKKYHCFIYHPDKKGWEKYEFLQKVETENPKEDVARIYNDLLDKPPNGVHSLDMWVTINGGNYSGIHCAFNGGGKADEIVLGEL